VERLLSLLQVLHKMSLSDKIFIASKGCQTWIKTEDVKQFIKKLKDLIMEELWSNDKGKNEVERIGYMMWNDALEEVDILITKLAGDELI